MFTFDHEAKKTLNAELRARNDELIELMFGANGIRPMYAEPRQGTRDATALAQFTARMTEYVDNALEIEDFPETTFRQVFSMNTNIDAGADVYVKNEIVSNGAADWIDENGQSIPMITVGVQPNTRPLRTLGLGYRITRKEILRATMSRRPIDMEKAMATRRMVEEKMDDVFWKGDTTVGIYGILNHPSIPIADATTGSWATATAAQIEADVLKMISNRATATLTANWTYQLGLPLAQYLKITQTRLDSSSYQTMTIAQWLIDQIPQLAGIFHSQQLYQASADSDDYGILIPQGSRWGQGLLSEDMVPLGPQDSSLLGRDYALQATVGGFFTLKPLAFEIIEDI